MMDIYCTFLLDFILNSILFSFRVKLEHLSKTFVLFPCCWNERGKLLLIDFSHTHWCSIHLTLKKRSNLTQTLMVTPTCFKNVVNAEAIAELKGEKVITLDKSLSTA